MKSVAHFVYPKNPKVFDVVKSNSKRSLALDTIKGEKGLCKWCLGKLDNNRKKYCSDNCRDSAWAFFYPQKYAHPYLMDRQDGKCNGCSYNFNDKTKTFKRKEQHGSDFNTYVDMGDVDHIVPIHQGGEILGIENHQLLCKSCHLRKTALERRLK